MENEMAKTPNKDEYYLKEMGLTTYFTGVKKLGFEKSLTQATIMNLKKISSESHKSHHVVIAISGFLTEDVDK
jgi:hypothetical protein